MFNTQKPEENVCVEEVPNSQIINWLASSLAEYSTHDSVMVWGPVFEPQPGYVCLGVLSQRMQGSLVIESNLKNRSCVNF